MKRALRTPKHFDAVDVPERGIGEDQFVVAQRPSINLEIEPRPCSRKERVGPLRGSGAVEAPDRGRKIACFGNDEVGDLRKQAGRRVESALLDV